MLDLIGAISLSSVFVLSVGLITTTARWSPSAKLLVAAGLLGWGALVVAVAAFHGFEAGSGPGIPNVAFGIVPPLMAVAFGWLCFPAVRRALAAVPTETLVLVNIGRVLGLFFILLQAQGRLTAPFASFAGWGDVATGLLAIPLAWHLLRGWAPHSAVLGGWNLLGALDLFVAVGLGVASAPDASFRIFTTPPGSASMGTLPWVLIPTVLVPLYLTTHVIIAAQLWRGPGTPRLTTPRSADPVHP